MYSPIDGPIHKRAPIAEEGYFYGIQWPAVLVRRKSDMKMMSVSRKKIRVFEKGYLCELDQRAQHTDEVKPDLGEIQDEDLGEIQDGANTESGDVGKWESSGGENFSPIVRPELNKNQVQSIKSLREHNFELPGSRPREKTVLEESAMSMTDQGGEGEYVDDTLSATALDQLTELISKAKGAAEEVPKLAIREMVL